MNTLSESYRRWVNQFVMDNNRLPSYEEFASWRDERSERQSYNISSRPSPIFEKLFKSTDDEDENIPIYQRNPEKVPYFSIVEGHYTAEDVAEGVKEIFTKGPIATALFNAGYDEVILHPTYREIVDVRDYDNSHQLHIFNCSIARGSSNVFKDYHFTEIIIDYDCVMHLTPAQSQGYRCTTPSRDFYDNNSNHIGFGDSNYLVIIFNLLGDKKYQAHLFHFLIRQWLRRVLGINIGPYLSHSDFEKLNTDEVREVFKDAFSKVSSDLLSEDFRNSAKLDVRVAFENYRAEVRKYNDKLRYLNNMKTLNDEEIAKRAESVVDALKLNPLISGCRIFGDTIKILTRPIVSPHWNGLKRIIITLPIYFSSDADKIYIHEFTNNTIRNLREAEGYIYEDAHICLGSLSSQIDMNLLTGEWDLAVLLVLRGLMGTEHFRGFMKHYDQAFKEAKEVIGDGEEEEDEWEEDEDYYED